MTNELKLYGVAELAARWKVTRQRASQITSDNVHKGRMAPPIELKCGRIWTEDQILEFEKNWERKSGRKVGYRVSK
jgi:hypothetical protein